MSNPPCGLLLGVLTGILSGVAIVGCGTQREAIDQKRLFAVCNPGEEKHYLEFSVASPDIYERFVKLGYAANLSVLRTMERGIKQGRDIDAFIAEYRSSLTRQMQDELAFINSLRKDIDADIDHLVFYRFEKDNKTEDGWAIIRHGGIRKKYPISFGEFLNVPSLP